MDSYHPIACDLHDYLEIACLYRYRLLLELEDGVRFEAEARTTHTRAVRPGGGKEEYLEVAVEGATLLLRLDRLLAITALTEAALFVPHTPEGRGLFQSIRHATFTPWKLKRFFSIPGLFD